MVGLVFGGELIFYFVIWLVNVMMERLVLLMLRFLVLMCLLSIEIRSLGERRLGGEGALWCQLGVCRVSTSAFLSLIL